MRPAVQCRSAAAHTGIVLAAPLIGRHRIRIRAMAPIARAAPVERIAAVPEVVDLVLSRQRLRRIDVGAVFHLFPDARHMKHPFGKVEVADRDG